MNMKKNKQKENPILSLCCNILIPVIILKNGNKWINKILIQYHGEEWFYPRPVAVFFICGMMIGSLIKHKYEKK